MNQEFTNLNVPSARRVRRPSPLAVAALWMVAIGGPAAVLYANGVREARRDAEARLLTQVAHAIQIPSAGREEVLTRLASNAREVTDARYVRVCNRLGVPMNWNTLFAEVRRRDKGGQAKAAQIIAEECGLRPDMPLKQEQMYLARRVMTGPIERAMPGTALAIPALN